jgi:hypothetical protein
MSNTFPDTGYTNGLKVNAFSGGLFISWMSPDRMTILTADAKDLDALPAAIRVLNERAAHWDVPALTVEQVRELA